MKTRRKQLGLTMQEVSELSHVPVPQIQRLESEFRPFSGCSMRFGLAICATLLLDPYEILDIDAEQAVASCIRPPERLDIREVPHEEE